MCSLLSDVERKNIESLAYRLGQSRLPLQGFIGWDAWDDEPLRHVLISQVKTHLGQADGVLVFDPSGFQSPVESQWGWPGSGAAGWAKSTPVKWPSTWAMSRVRAILWWTRGCPCPKNGRRRRPGWTKRTSRTPAAASARGTNWPWRCSRPTAPRCPTGGLPVTTRWGGRIGFGVAWLPWASTICSRSPRTRRYAIWRRPQRPPGRDAAPSAPGKAWRSGASRLTRRPGGASMYEMVRKVHWWSRWSNGVWSPGPIGASKAPRNCWR